MLKLITHASELLTGQGIRTKDGRKVEEQDVGRIGDAALVYEISEKTKVPGKIRWVGRTSELPTKYKKLKALNLKNQRAIIPGLVDCHTHLVFAGNRADEFAARCGGATYDEIAAQGGGILKTVSATREATVQELEKIATERLREMEAFGVRTVEIKSGYGLTPESEYRVLEVIPRLRKKFPHLTLRATFLGAHDFPKEISRERYLQQLCEEMIPHVDRHKLADSCDVFIDRGYYTVPEAEKILKTARKHGLQIKVHADELANTESAFFAAKIGALSADHLLQISDRGIAALANSQTVAVLLPGTAFYLKAPHAPARKLIDAGACVAISTDFNPGTSMCLSLPTVMTIAALYLSLSRAELLASVTYNAAKALGLEQYKGTLEVGMDADFAILPFEKFEEMYYRFAWSARY